MLCQLKKTSKLHNMQKPERSPKNIKDMLKRNCEISKKVTESGHVELAATSPSSGAPKATWNTESSRKESTKRVY